MSLAYLHHSPFVASLFSWLHGTRIRYRGDGHQVACLNSVLRGTEIEILGSHCRLTVGPGARLWDCSITLKGDGAELNIGADCRLRHARLSVEDQGTRLLIGAKTSITGATLVAQEGRLLQVGEDCMIAQHAELRNSDSHAIYDHDNVRLNPPQDVVVGHHVWIGLGAFVFKGANIGHGSIIGARSLVVSEIPSSCVAYGVPASTRISPIRWERGRDARGRPTPSTSRAPHLSPGTATP
jgi:acetyltransferase-like isoleucine patch superfamily enzyme